MFVILFDVAKNSFIAKVVQLFKIFPTVVQGKSLKY